MKSTAKYQLLIGVLLVASLFVAGCSDSGGSAAIEPYADEPMIIESAMCIGDSNDRPDGITDTFLTTDDRIYVWLYWTNIEGTSSVRTVWYKPSQESALREDTQTIRSDSGYGITYFYIDRPSGGFEEGEWIVEIYLDGEFHRSYLFYVD